MPTLPQFGDSSSPLLPPRDQQLVELAQEHRASNPFTGHRTAADPHRSARSRSDSQPGVISEGVVVGFDPYCHWYKVQLGIGGHISARAGLYGSTSPVGGRTLNPYPSGTRVILYLPTDLNAIILCSVPHELTENDFNLPDFILQGGNTGLRAEDGLQHVIRNMYRSGGVRDYNNGRPVDATQLDQGWIHETGVALLHNMFGVQLRLDEYTGLFLNYLDRSMRVSGEQLDLWSAAVVERHRNDEGELGVVREVYFSQAEALGLYVPQTHVDEVDDAEDSQYYSVRGYFDLKDDDQDRQPFGRVQSAESYLAQGQRRAVITTTKTSGRRKYSDPPTEDVGLFQEHLGVDGALFIQSAKRVGIVKSLGVPSIKQRKEFSDKDGDDAAAENYRFSGEGSAGDEHKFQAPKYGESDSSEDAEIHHLRRGAGKLDTLAQYMNWLASGAFVKHKNDWTVQEPSEAPDGLGDGQEKLDFSVLKGRGHLSAPQPSAVRIGPRRIEQYYKRMSGFLLDDDGAVRIFCGYGNSIELGPHGIVLGTPANVYLTAGRHLVAKTGGDVNIEAQNSVDLFAGTGDLRLKAKRNLHAMAGNPGASSDVNAGSILFECLSPVRTQEFKSKFGEEVAAGGIVFKAAKSDIVMLAGGIYGRTGGGDLLDGPIVFDANKGRNSFNVYARNVNMWTAQGLGVWIGPTNEDSSVSSGHFFGKTAIITGGLDVQGFGLFSRSVSVGGALGAAGSIVSGGNVASSSGGLLGKAPGAATQIQENVQKAAESIQKFTDTGTTIHGASIVERWYKEENLPGNDECIKAIRFSYRDDPTGFQYGVDGLRFPEVHYQQLARLGGADGAVKYTADLIKIDNERLFPWPGRKAWEEEDVMDAADPVLYSVSSGRPRDRSTIEDSYANGETAALEPRPMKELFTVTMEPRHA